MRQGSKHGPFVFVSHAKADKKAVPLLREVVARLIDAGLAVWIDDPDAFPDFREQASACLKLRGGRKWDDQIDEALDEAACILICVSPKFVERFREDRQEVIRNEVWAAKAGKRAVVARLARVDWADMPAWIEREQIVDLVDTPGKITDLIEDVQATLKRVNRQRLGKGAETPNWAHPFAPYLADRRPQEEEIALYLKDRASSPAPWRSAFFLKGPRNECLDQFRQRLKEHTTPACLPDRLSWAERLVDWPVGAGTGDEFMRRYAHNVDAARRKVDLTITSGPEASTGRPEAMVSVIQLEEWHAGQPGLIEAWLKYWHTQITDAPRLRVVPVLCLELPRLAPGWRAPPNIRERGGVSARRIWKDVGRIAQRSARDNGLLELRRLDVLSPIQRADAVNWQRTQFTDTSGSQWRQLDQHYDQLFSGRARRHGIAMQDWADQIGKILNTPQT